MASISQLIRKLVLAPFGNRGTELQVNDIPLNIGSIPNQMSWNQGIPAITAEPVKEDGTGGIPSRGGDHAGLHNVWSTNQYLAQFGIMPNEYDVRFQSDSNFGGYPRGAIVIFPAGDSVDKSYYLSLANNNTFEPTNATYWRNLFPKFPTLDLFPRFPDWNASKYFIGGQNNGQGTATWVANTTLTMPYDCWFNFYTDSVTNTHLRVASNNKTFLYAVRASNDDDFATWQSVPMRAGTTVTNVLQIKDTRVFIVGMETV